MRIITQCLFERSIDVANNHNFLLARTYVTRLSLRDNKLREGNGSEVVVLSDVLDFFA